MLRRVGAAAADSSSPGTGFDSLPAKHQGYDVVHSETLLIGVARIRDVETGPDGAVYLLLEHASGGQIVRLVPDELSTKQAPGGILGMVGLAHSGALWRLRLA